MNIISFSESIKMVKRIKYVVPFFVPFVAFAQSLTNIENLVKGLGGIVETALPIVVGIALLAFFWGLAKFIFSAGSEDAKDEGKRIMIWGAIAIFVMVSIFGIVGFIQSTIGGGLDKTDDFKVPGVEGIGS